MNLRNMLTEPNSAKVSLQTAPLLPANEEIGNHKRRADRGAIVNFVAYHAANNTR
jgi:hypothetical protein